MTIVVSGHRVDIDSDLRREIISDILKMSGKLETRMTSCHVTFERGPRDLGHRCEILGYFPGNKDINASGAEASEDVNLAYRKALRKFESQILRQKKSVPHLRLVDSNY
jgi:ribosome-associated translation inhibitor RaiA